MSANDTSAEEHDEALDAGLQTSPDARALDSSRATSSSAGRQEGTDLDEVHAVGENGLAAQGFARQATDTSHDVDDAQDDAQDEDGLDDAQDEDGLDDAQDEDGPVDAQPAPRVSRGRRPLSHERTEQLERDGEVAADFLERLLDIADIDGDIDVDIDGDRAVVAIVDSEDGRVPRRLVGTDGNVLEALQELTRLAVQAETGDRSRLMLDVAGHRATRRTIVIGEAREAMAQVHAGADRVAMHPMTAFERKVVHDEVLAAGLVSESDGVEPSRFVVIYPV